MLGRRGKDRISKFISVEKYKNKRLLSVKEHRAFAEISMIVAPVRVETGENASTALTLIPAIAPEPSTKETIAKPPLEIWDRMQIAKAISTPLEMVIATPRIIQKGVAT